MITKIPLRDFFLGDRLVQMTDDQILFAVHIPLNSTPNTKTFIRAYKQAQRREDSKGIVSAGFRVELEASDENSHSWNIVSLCFSFGGMASKTITAKQTEQQLLGRLWSKETINLGYQILLEEMPLDEMSYGGRPEYRYVES